MSGVTLSVLEAACHPGPQSAHWYAIRTRCRYEKTAAAHLQACGITTFLPILSQLHRWSDRNKVVIVPLFPQYLFVRTDNSGETRLRILQTPGVLEFVRDAMGPAVVPEWEIEAIRVVLASEVEYAPCSFLKMGDRVRVIRGPLSGVEGRFIRGSSGGNLVLSVDMVQQSVSVRIDSSDVEYLQESAGLELTPLNSRWQQTLRCQG